MARSSRAVPARVASSVSSASHCGVGLSASLSQKRSQMKRHDCPAISFAKILVIWVSGIVATLCKSVVKSFGSWRWGAPSHISSAAFSTKSPASRFLTAPSSVIAARAYFNARVPSASAIATESMQQQPNAATGSESFALSNKMSNRLSSAEVGFLWRLLTRIWRAVSSSCFPTGIAAGRSLPVQI